MLKKSNKGEKGAVMPNIKLASPFRLQNIIAESTTKQSLRTVLYLIFKRAS